jgi:hypothetical protein
MTDRTPRSAPGQAKKRLSRRAVRTIAWVAGGAAFAAPWGVLALQPKPVSAAPQPEPTRQVIIHRIVRHVYTKAPVSKAPKVRYVYAPAHAAPAPATSSGGSKP